MLLNVYCSIIFFKPNTVTLHCLLHLLEKFLKMSSSTFYKSVGYKILMALSGLFLMVFLLQHLLINSMSVISPDLFNEASHFYGN